MKEELRNQTHQSHVTWRQRYLRSNLRELSRVGETSGFIGEHGYVLGERTKFARSNFLSLVCHQPPLTLP